MGELVQHFGKFFIVHGTQHFADPMSGVLDSRYCRTPDPSGLHLNKYGIAQLVRLVKNSIFQVKTIGSRVHSNRTYAKAAA